MLNKALQSSISLSFIMYTDLYLDTVWQTNDAVPVIRVCNFPDRHSTYVHTMSGVVHRRLMHRVFPFMGNMVFHKKKHEFIRCSQWFLG
jgi:hypothetical protein